MSGFELFSETGVRIFDSARPTFYIRSTEDYGTLQGSSSPPFGTNYNGRPNEFFSSLSAIFDFSWDASAGELVAVRPLMQSNYDWFAYWRVWTSNTGNITRMFYGGTNNYYPGYFRVYKIRIGRPPGITPSFGINIFSETGESIFTINDRVAPIAHAYSGLSSNWSGVSLNPNRKYAICYFDLLPPKEFAGNGTRYFYYCDPVGWHNGQLKLLSRESGKKLMLYEYITAAGNYALDYMATNGVGRLSYILFDVTDL